MRTPIVILAGSLLLTACVSGTRVVYVPTPGTTPAPAAVPTPQPSAPAMVPVGVTIVRPEDSRLLVSTNQPAYLAVFEIVPNGGVTLVYPTTATHRQTLLSGSSWLPIAWRSQRGGMPAGRNAREGYGQQSSVHYVYAIASDRPLRLTAGAFDDANLRGMLGGSAYFAANPYETMGALSRQFVPPGTDEGWGEDLYTMDMTRPGMATARVAKVYCADGSVTYVRDEIAARAACPARVRGTASTRAGSPRPDSVVASNGRPVQRGYDPKMRTPVYRVPKPTVAQGMGQGNSGARSGDRPVVANNGGAANGSGTANGNQSDARDNNGNHYGWDKVKQASGNNGNNGNASDVRPSQPSSEPSVRQQGNPDHPTPGAQPEPKPEPKPEVKEDLKPKGNANSARGMMERMKEHTDSSSAKDQKKKSD